MTTTQSPGVREQDNRPRRGPGRPRKSGQNHRPPGAGAASNGGPTNRVAPSPTVSTKKVRFAAYEGCWFAVAHISFGTIIYAGQSMIKAADVLEPGTCYAIGPTAEQAKDLAADDATRFKALKLGPMPEPKFVLKPRLPARLEEIFGQKTA